MFDKFNCLETEAQRHHKERIEIEKQKLDEISELSNRLTEIDNSLNNRLTDINNSLSTQIKQAELEAEQAKQSAKSASMRAWISIAVSILAVIVSGFIGFQSNCQSNKKADPNETVLIQTQKE